MASIFLAILIGLLAGIAVFVVRNRRRRSLQISNSAEAVPAVYKDQNVYLGTPPPSDVAGPSYQPSPNYPTSHLQSYPPNPNTCKSN